ncbi:hypothetical protein EC950183_4004, partial [Escherichia coli 95.0183]
HLHAFYINYKNVFRQ